MSLRGKIGLSFLIGASIIAALVGFEYVNYVRMEKEIRFLEITDTIRSKSLQLRRHEKNFFIYSPGRAREESAAVQSYINELNDVIGPAHQRSRTERAWLDSLGGLVGQYGKRFDSVVALVNSLDGELGRLKKPGLQRRPAFLPLIETSFYDHPLDVAKFLREAFLLQPEAPLIAGLNRLDSEVNGLRKTGEEINALSKELDKAARDRVEAGINLSQKAILVFFPAFLLVGIGLVFSISNNVVRRLKLLTGLVQRTMGGVFPHLEPSTRWGRDEVGLLIGKFGEMSEQLEKREAEIKAKNRELLQSKKLAAIGTLASGVAHEINNPLNNIYLSAQVLERQKQDKRADGETIIGDIIKETRRVRSIVGDLLEFAREGEPSLARTDAAALMKEAYSRVSEHFSETQKIDFSLEASGAPQGLFIDADPEQIERVFINILSNAVDAMQGTGHLLVDLCAEGGYAVIRVSDTGAGIAEEDLEKIFDPFYTTKEKGTGLGLAIVLNIIRKHGGEITVASAPGKGARFTIKLPLHKGGA